MSEFKELIKSFPKTREYVRDFFVYGFKTRDDFKEKSARTYDNERRRIESWLSGFVRQDYNDKGKNISLAIDSNLLDTNPLYRVWKTKSFTDNDIMLHFFLLDYLSDIDGMTIEAITDGIIDEYAGDFDVQMVRRKCNAYVKEGLLRKEKQGKDLLYYKNPDFKDIIAEYNMLASALQYYQISAPLGIVGDTILDNISKPNDTFRVKHSFFVHTLEDEILLKLLDSMHHHQSIEILTKGTKTSNEVTMRGIPMQIFTSTRTGRRFLCLYGFKSKRFTCIRMDSVKKVEPLERIDNYTALQEKLRNCYPYLWGVSFGEKGQPHIGFIKLTLRIREDEQFIVERLQREGKGGVITCVEPNIYTYEKEVFDTNELLPWLRTFTGRIIDIECSSEQTKKLFFNDMQAMFDLYNI
ncbi:MAG: hypothetical protein J6C01_08630 [Lachnospiraceae bacterium]|nr:hypothetical protein [Lachnospiraceae bacterium]